MAFLVNENVSDGFFRTRNESKLKDLPLITPKPISSEKPPSVEKKEDRKSYSMSWAQRLKRVFGIDIQTCSRCGGKVRLISAIEEVQVIQRILTHLGKD